jgi:hypothetical protein
MCFSNSRDVLNNAGKLLIPNFRGVFNDNNLPDKPWVNETMVVCLGFHYVCFSKQEDFVRIFDHTGAFPTYNLLKYLRGNALTWNAYQVSTDCNSCEYLCLLKLLNDSF